MIESPKTTEGTKDSILYYAVWAYLSTFGEESWQLLPYPLGWTPPQTANLLIEAAAAGAHTAWMMLTTRDKTFYMY